MTRKDILLTYFIEHINWIFQTVHIPTFRKEYSNFWDGEIEKADLVWMSLLFTILSLSALYIPGDVVELVRLQRGSIRRYADTWHHATRQALQAGNFEEKPTLIQLQTFSVTQLYWYATNNIEVLNSRMGQAIRNAQALGLHKDRVPARNVDEEMRHRLWWDLVDSDTFQSICLDRPPLIQVHLWEVPFPLNCNDSDLGNDFAKPHPLTEPTAMSMNIYRARVFQLINKALVSNPSQFRSYKFIVDLDRELLRVMEKLPWYSKLDTDRKVKLFPGAYDFLPWENHILRTCVSTQRIRMYRPFLADQSNNAFNECLAAVEDALLVYRTLRDDKSMRSQQKFYPQAYQIFSVAVTLAALLLVERIIPQAAQFRVDVQTMATDLKVLEDQASPVPVAANGHRVLLKMMELFEQGDTCSPEDTERLVPDISIILGGESSTRAYLGRRVCHGLQHQRMLGQTTTVAEQIPSAQGQEHHNAADPVMNTLVDDQDLSFDPMLEPGEGMFDFDQSQLEDPYELFSWDMTGLLSDATTGMRPS
ncbi:fungal-specific transcription factor domain-containing protein [Exophiala viscosa]|uniref:fungal-specific transcription factor domain-containing protein n=1 Tax=Exophiala viscosa TaxID=2486360 RepID=UPI002197F911|nr:fungal-specific transcription factor domain-containing protein [Exophiala viscosa]